KTYTVYIYELEYEGFALGMSGLFFKKDVLPFQEGEYFCDYVYVDEDKDVTEQLEEFWENYLKYLKSEEEKRK
ncbi:MAG: hypothetical protein AAFU33_08990, partial [Bacteroidota bacterium]